MATIVTSVMGQPTKPLTQFTIQPRVTREARTEPTPIVNLTPSVIHEALALAASQGNMEYKQQSQQLQNPSQMEDYEAYEKSQNYKVT